MAPRIWSLSKSAAGYRPAPRPEVSCRACEYMFPRLAVGGCKFVRGVVRASDTCNEFSPTKPDRGPSSES